MDIHSNHTPKWNDVPKTQITSFFGRALRKLKKNNTKNMKTMLVGLAEFEAYIKAYLEYSSRYIRIIDSSIRNRIFQKCLLQPYKIVGTVSVKHGVSIEFIEQTSKYEFEVKMVPCPIEEAVLPQRNSRKAMFNIGSSRFITFESLCLFSHEFEEKYVKDAKGATILSYSKNLDGFINLSTGSVQFYHCQLGAIICGKPKTREIGDGLWIDGNNDAKDFKVEKAYENAKEAIDAALAQFIYPDLKIGSLPENKATTIARYENKIHAFEKLLSKPDVKEPEIQKFFEENPEFLCGIRYKRVVSHPVLPRDGKSDLIPDFLLERVNDSYCDILDIKLPDKKLVVGSEERRRFSGSVDEALAQVSEYREYFDESANRKYIETKYSLKILKPNVLVLIGDSANIDKEELIKIKDRRKDGEVVTYSDISSQMRALLNIIKQK
jgi:hypothetical protein